MRGVLAGAAEIAVVWRAGRTRPPPAPSNAFDVFA